MRARLVAQEQGAPQGVAESEAGGDAGFAFESPLIEQGSVILGGTEQALDNRIEPIVPPKQPRKAQHHAAEGA